MIDTHCHIAGNEFAADLGDVVTRAQAAGLTGAIVIIAADDPAEVARTADVRAAWPAVRFATGIHPHAAGRYAGHAADAVAATAGALSQIGDAVAVGEIGMDYHYDVAPKDAQRDVFAAQVELAVWHDLPVVIHTREAMSDTAAVLREAGQGRVRGVIHCFTGSADDARTALDLGFYVSFAGILTFPKAQALREAAAVVPVDRLLVETDAPYLAPVPHRGQRNEPAWVQQTLATLAGVKGLTPAAMGLAVVANARRLFLTPR